LVRARRKAAASARREWRKPLQMGLGERLLAESNERTTMSIPYIPNESLGAAPLDDKDLLDEGESSDDQATVEQDEREADAVNENLEK
jgi:hypothetical protein